MTTEPIRTMTIDTLGHAVHTGHLEDEIRHGKEIWDKLAAEAAEKGERDWTPYGESLRGESRECGRCGRHLRFKWSGVEGENPVLSSQSKLNYTPPHVPERFDADARCPMPVRPTTILRFTCKSGRIAMANDLREYFPDRDDDPKARSISVNNYAGQIAYMKWYASNGYLTAWVEPCAWFIPAEGGLDVVYPNDGFEDDAEYDRLEDESIHMIHTGLWWFCIVDAADLPEGVLDGKYGSPGVMDLEPGEYEMTVYPDAHRVATLRRVEG